MPAFNNVDELNKYLENYSYVNGYTPSAADVTTFKNIGSEPDSHHANAARWYRQIASYTAEERAAWGGEEASSASAPAAAKKEAAPAADDDDVDLFGDDDEEADEAWEQERARRAKELEDKRAAEGKTKPIPKSMVIIDVKPIDDETKMEDIEEHVRGITLDGLGWKTSKLVDVAYGIKKLQITAIIEDDKVSMDEVEELILANEDIIQSMDIVAFNKL